MPKSYEEMYAYIPFQIRTQTPLGFVRRQDPKHKVRNISVALHSQ